MSESRDKPTISAPKGTWGSLLAAPRLLSASTSTQPSTPCGTVLRPPQLKTGCNPFTKVHIDDKTKNDKNESSAVEPVPKLPQVEEKEGPPKEAIPKFLPLHSSVDSISFAGGTNVPTASTEAITTNCNFVFGQNLQDRIVKSNEESNGESSGNHVDHPATNGTSELLFSSAVKASTDTHSLFNKQDDSSTSNLSSTSWSWVSESPAPAIPPSGPIITGEEDEDNVIQMNCRLFAFEDGQWKERGRGQLRLNDSEHGSRLVCRSAGSLRVLLNTKVWGDMTVDTAGAKSLRVTATDSQQQVKVFLIMARPVEILHLSKYLQMRVTKAKLKDDLRIDCKEINSSKTSVPSMSIINRSQKPETSTDNSVSASQSEVTSTGEEEKVTCQDNHKEATADCKTDGNPVVIVSHEDEDVLRVKRPLETDQENVQSKKICAEQPDGEEAL